MAGKKNIKLREKVKLFHDKGLTNTEIAKELGYKNMSSIGYFLKEMGLKSNYDKNIKLRDIMKPEEYALLVVKIKEKINKISQSMLQEELNISKGQLKTILKDEKIEVKLTEDIRRAKKSALSLEEREKAFAEELNQKDRTKIYHHGFKNTDSRVYIKCLICGSVYEINASVVRSKHNNVYCKKCSEQNKALRQKERQKELEAERKKNKENKEKQDRLRQLNKYLANSKQLTFNVCSHCGKLFVGTSKYCSKRCRERNHEQRMTRLRIERAKENGKVDYGITLDKLIARDKNICYICNKECNESDYTYQGNNFIAGDYYPSIDHVIPIAKGGTHTWNNVKLAHRICNSIKSDRV